MIKTESNCIDFEVGRLFEDAKSNILLAPARALDREAYYNHLDECQACRDAMLNHANEVVIEQVAIDKGVAADDILEELRQAAEALEETARRRGISLAEALGEVLRRNKQMSLTAGKEASR